MERASGARRLGRRRRARDGRVQHARRGGGARVEAYGCVRRRHRNSRALVQASHAQRGDRRRGVLRKTLAPHERAVRRERRQPRAAVHREQRPPLERRQRGRGRRHEQTPKLRERVVRRVVFFVLIVRSVGITKIALFDRNRFGKPFRVSREPSRVYAAADDAASAGGVGDGDAPRVREHVGQEGRETFRVDRSDVRRRTDRASRESQNPVVQRKRVVRRERRSVDEPSEGFTGVFPSGNVPAESGSRQESRLGFVARDEQDVLLEQRVPEPEGSERPVRQRQKRRVAQLRRGGSLVGAVEIEIDVAQAVRQRRQRETRIGDAGFPRRGARRLARRLARQPRRRDAHRARRVREKRLDHTRRNTVYDPLAARGERARKIAPRRERRAKRLGGDVRKHARAGGDPLSF